MSGARKHDGHTLILIAEEATVEFPIVISEEGNVEEAPHGAAPIIDWYNSPCRVFCITWQETVGEGEDGLAEDWEWR